jgi:DNA-binding NarL/FixJ family response regulator
MINQAARQSGGGMSHSGQTEGPSRRESQANQPDLTVGKASPAASTVKVLIVDDALIFRERLVALMADLRNVAIVGQAEDGFQAQTLFRQHRPDAVVLDIQLPGASGMDLLVEFKREHPTCVVIVLTTYAFKEFRIRCTALGADHFFDKSADFERVIEVLDTLQPGGNSSAEAAHAPSNRTL